MTTVSIPTAIREKFPGVNPYPFQRAIDPLTHSKTGSAFLFCSKTVPELLTTEQKIDMNYGDDFYLRTQVFKNMGESSEITKYGNLAKSVAMNISLSHINNSFGFPIGVNFVDAKGEPLILPKMHFGNDKQLYNFIIPAKTSSGTTVKLGVNENILKSDMFEMFGTLNLKEMIETQLKKKELNYKIEDGNIEIALPTNHPLPVFVAANIVNHSDDEFYSQFESQFATGTLKFNKSDLGRVSNELLNHTKKLSRSDLTKVTATLFPLVSMTDNSKAEFTKYLSNHSEITENQYYEIQFNAEITAGQQIMNKN